MLGRIGHARFVIEEAYDADPTRAQYGMTPEQFSAVGGPLKLPTELLAEDDSGDTEGGALVFTPALHEQATTPASLQ